MYPLVDLLFVFLLIGVIHSVRSYDCSLDRDRGYACKTAADTKFYFDKNTGVCQPLFLRGCGGNENQFGTKLECEEKCKSDSNQKTENSTNTKELQTVARSCSLNIGAILSDEVQMCDEGCPLGYTCSDNGICCPSKDYICNLPISSGREQVANKHYGRYAFSPGLNNCIRFSYFGLDGNYNNFVRYQDCKKFCDPEQ